MKNTISLLAAKMVSILLVAITFVYVVWAGFYYPTVIHDSTLLAEKFLKVIGILVFCVTIGTLYYPGFLLWICIKEALLEGITVKVTGEKSHEE